SIGGAECTRTESDTPSESESVRAPYVRHGGRFARLARPLRIIDGFMGRPLLQARPRSSARRQARPAGWERSHRLSIGSRRARHEGWCQRDLGAGRPGIARGPGDLAASRRPRRLGLRPGRVGLPDGTLRMDAGRRIDGRAADRAARPRRDRRGVGVRMARSHGACLPGQATLAVSPMRLDETRTWQGPIWRTGTSPPYMWPPRMPNRTAYPIRSSHEATSPHGPPGPLARRASLPERLPGELHERPTGDGIDLPEVADAGQEDADRIAAPGVRGFLARAGIGEGEDHAIADGERSLGGRRDDGRAAPAALDVPNPCFVRRIA